MAKRRPSGNSMVRKRENGRWEGRIVVGRKENGDLIFRYTYADTQKELTAKLRQDITAYQGVDLTEECRMPLSEWLDRWLTDYKENTVRPGTLAGYRSCIENYIKPQLGGKQVSLVTSQDVQKLYRRLKENGRVREHPRFGSALSDTTTASTQSSIRQWRTPSTRISSLKIPPWAQRCQRQAMRRNVS